MPFHTIRRRPKKAPRKPEPVTGRHENEALTGKMEQWESAVFDNAAYFQVTVIVSQTDKRTERYTTFDQAVELALKLIAAGYPRTLVYAVSQDDRSFCIPAEQWGAYLAREHSK